MRTKEKLAQVCEAEGMPELAQRARAGEFDDFESESPTPHHDLYNEFIKRKRKDLARRVVDGEWDSTKAESDEWARSEDGQAAFALLEKQEPARPAPTPTIYDFATYLAEHGVAESLHLGEPATVIVVAGSRGIGGATAVRVRGDEGDAERAYHLMSAMVSFYCTHAINPTLEGFLEDAARAFELQAEQRKLGMLRKRDEIQ